MGLSHHNLALHRLGIVAEGVLQPFRCPARAHLPGLKPLQMTALSLLCAIGNEALSVLELVKLPVLKDSATCGSALSTITFIAWGGLDKLSNALEFRVHPRQTSNSVVVRTTFDRCNIGNVTEPPRTDRDL